MKARGALTTQDLENELLLGMTCALAATIPAGLDIWLVGHGKTELKSRKSKALWASAFGLGAIGVVLFADVVYTAVGRLPRR